MAFMERRIPTLNGVPLSNAYSWTYRAEVNNVARVEIGLYAELIDVEHVMDVSTDSEHVTITIQEPISGKRYRFHAVDVELLEE